MFLKSLKVVIVTAILWSAKMDGTCDGKPIVDDPLPNRLILCKSHTHFAQINHCAKIP